MKKFIFLLFVVTNITRCQLFKKDADLALFDNTPAERIANAIELQDTARIESLVMGEKININYQEPKFDFSLLDLALKHNKVISVIKMLHLGANPNLREPHDNNLTPFLYACRLSPYIDNAPYIISLMITCGADVNAEQVKELPSYKGIKHFYKRTCLQYLCESSTLECVKILVENGARLDIYPKNGEGSILYSATINPGFDILHYLLIEKKVPIPDYCVISQKGTKFEKKISLRQLIVEDLRINKNKERLKIEMLDFLAAHGK